MRIRNKEMRARRNRKDKRVKEIIKDLRAGKVATPKAAAPAAPKAEPKPKTEPKAKAEPKPKAEPKAKAAEEKPKKAPAKKKTEE